MPENLTNQTVDAGTISCEIIRSKRKTIAVTVTGDAKVIVRCPNRMAKKEIRAFLEAHKGWIEKHLQEAKEKAALPAADPFTPEELKTLRKEAAKRIPARVEFYAAQMGVSYGCITIRSQRRRWGSCSSKGNLNFNCLLLLTTPEVLDSVVVHELAHRKHMNHSKAFYDEVLSVFPEYKACDQWLKKNGGAILRRLPEQT